MPKTLQESHSFRSGTCSWDASEAVRLPSHVPLVLWQRDTRPLRDGISALARRRPRVLDREPCEMIENTPPAKPRVLIFLGYYLPGVRAGGPIKTISNF